MLAVLQFGECGVQNSEFDFDDGADKPLERMSHVSHPPPLRFPARLLGVT